MDLRMVNRILWLLNSLGAVEAARMVLGAASRVAIVLDELSEQVPFVAVSVVARPALEAMLARPRNFDLVQRPEGIEILLLRQVVQALILGDDDLAGFRIE